MTTIVRTQAQLDKAIAAHKADIIIDSPVTVQLTVRDSSHVVARGSSRVVARDSSRVVARGSSRVVAWGSSRVVARDSSHVVARGSSRVVARGSSRVVARDSSRVEARGSSRVVAWGSSRVEAWDSSSVEARDSSSVVASKYVAVHLSSANATSTGGVVIDLTGLNLENVQEFIDYHGVTIRDGHAVLYKAVDDDLYAGHSYTKTRYPIGEEVTAPDWQPTQECGHGLHLGHRPSVAHDYYPAATRFLECETPIEGLIALGDKAKCRTLRVIREVDIHGEAVT